MLVPVQDHNSQRPLGKVLTANLVQKKFCVVNEIPDFGINFSVMPEDHLELRPDPRPVFRTLHKDRGANSEWEIPGDM